MPSDDQILQKLAATSDTTAWIPRDVYAGLIIEQAQAARLLAGVAGAVEYATPNGTGNSVLVRYFPKRSAQGAISEGNSLSAVVTTPTATRITFSKYGDYDILTGESIMQTSDNYKAQMLKRFGMGLARKFDEVAYGVLKAASAANTTATLATTGDLVTGNDFLLKIMACVDSMRAAKDVVPTHIILGPDQINALAQTKTVDNRIGSAISVGADGRPNSVYGLKVVDLFSIANRNVTTAASVQAVIIDSSRAFGEVYGRPVTFEELRVPENDTWKEVVWAEYGAALLDKDGVGWVKNP